MHGKRITSLLLAAPLVLLGACGEDLPLGVPADAAFHLEGWVGESAHTAAFYGNRESCARCHGEALDGGLAAVSCEQCHPGWKTDCTFCHGGADSESGAPPLGVNGETERSQPAVGAHTAHLTEGPAHLAYPCAACHAVPASIDDPGHLDATPGAEVGFRAPNDAGAFYDTAPSNCAATYCHSNGRGAPTTVKWTASGPLGCDACHGDATNPAGMSGKHGSHLNLGLVCADCHADVAGAGGTLIDKRLHVNGTKDVALPSGAWDATGQSCDSSCHSGPELRTW